MRGSVRGAPGNGRPYREIPSFILDEFPEAEIRVIELRRAACSQVHVRPTKKSTCIKVGRQRGQTIAEADVSEGVGEPHTS